MNQYTFNFNSLHEFAIPTTGSYSQLIGSVICGDYNTKVTKFWTLFFKFRKYKLIFKYNQIIKPVISLFTFITYYPLRILYLLYKLISFYIARNPDFIWSLYLYLLYIEVWNFICYIFIILFKQFELREIFTCVER